MRYIGNKTKLLKFLRARIRRLGITPGTVHDAFSGTAAVGRALKADGWRVHSSDLMEYSYVFQRAYVVAGAMPNVADLRAAVPLVAKGMRDAVARARAAGKRLTPIEAVASALERDLAPASGFITAQFSPEGARGYFTTENAMRIDAIRTVLHRWRADGLISDDAYYLLLAALIEAADRVANTAGVYAAYIKQWQPNARKPLSLRVTPPLRGRLGSTAHRADAADVARSLGKVDLIYIDPPYNSRQYAGYYHIPEIIARGWFGETPALRGKTGLSAYASTRSAWSEPKHAERALRELLEATGARHALVSYNSEGLMSESALKSALEDASIDGKAKIFRHEYKRYRADRDHAKRRYAGDRVSELLCFARLRR